MSFERVPNNHPDRFMLYVEGRGFESDNTQFRIEIIAPDEKNAYREERTIVPMLNGIFSLPFEVRLNENPSKGWYRVNVYLDDHLAQQTTFLILMKVNKIVRLL